jgi:hypothetical protein
VKLRVGDVILGPREDSDAAVAYADQFSLTGEMMYEGLWASVRFDRNSLFLVVGVTEPDPNDVTWYNRQPIDFQVDLLALEVGYFFKLRGQLADVVATCDVMRRE